MKTGFNKPNAIKKQAPENKPEEGIRSPWDFTCPHYDQRSSCFVNAGTHFGVGHRQPVGHQDNPSGTAITLPTDRRSVKTMECDEAG